MKYIKKISTAEIPPINGAVVDTFDVTNKTTNAPSIRAIEEKFNALPKYAKLVGPFDVEASGNLQVVKGWPDGFNKDNSFVVSLYVDAYTSSNSFVDTEYKITRLGSDWIFFDIKNPKSEAISGYYKVLLMRFD